jgi:hypothetical protein
MNERINNRRIFEAIELIDPAYIDEMFDGMKVPERKEVSDGEKKNPFKHWKPIAAMAACLILLSAVIPLLGYLIPDLNFGGEAGAVTAKTDRVVSAGDAQYYGEYMYFHEIGAKLLRMNTVSGECDVVCGHDDVCPDDCLLRSVDLYGLSNIDEGKLYLYSKYADGEYNYRIVCLDLESGEAEVLCELESQINSHLFAEGGYVYFSRKSGIFRASELGEELLIEGTISLLMLADGKAVTINREADSLPIPYESSVLEIYDIESGGENRLLNTYKLDGGIVLEGCSYLDGILYYKARDEVGYALYSLDVESEKAKRIVKDPIRRFFVAEDGVYYFPYEKRTVNWHNPVSAIAYPARETVGDGPSLHRCDHDGKNDIVVYTNYDIGYWHYSVAIGNGHIAGLFFGDFPSIDKEFSMILGTIDLNSGKLTESDYSTWFGKLNDIYNRSE